MRKRCLDFLIDSSFPFVLSFKDEDGRECHRQYYAATVEIKDFNVMIDARTILNQSIKNDLKTYDHIRKIATGEGDDCRTGCLLDYLYFKSYYELIAIDLSKQQKLDSEPKAKQENNFTRNLDRTECATIFLIIEEAKETILDFSTGTAKLL